MFVDTLHLLQHGVDFVLELPVLGPESLGFLLLVITGPSQFGQQMNNLAQDLDSHLGVVAEAHNPLEILVVGKLEIVEGDILGFLESAVHFLFDFAHFHFSESLPSAQKVNDFVHWVSLYVLLLSS